MFWAWGFDASKLALPDSTVHSEAMHPNFIHPPTHEVSSIHRNERQNATAVHLICHALQLVFDLGVLRLDFHHFFPQIICVCMRVSVSSFLPFLVSCQLVPQESRRKSKQISALIRRTPSLSRQAFAHTIRMHAHVHTNMQAERLSLALFAHQSHD